MFFYNFTTMAPDIMAYLAESPPNPTNLVYVTNTISRYSSVYIQNLTNHLWVCNDVVKNVYMWGNFKLLEFTDWIDFATSFFQSIIAKSLSFTNIYTSITSK